MNHLNELRIIKEEVDNMPFSYEHVHRIMHLVYISKNHLNTSSPIPNKEIALHQVTKITESDFEQIIKSANSKDLQSAYDNLITNFGIALNYF